MDTKANKNKFNDKEKHLSKKNKLIITIANNYGQKLLLKTCNGLIFRVLCCTKKIILKFQKIIFNHC